MILIIALVVLVVILAIRLWWIFARPVRCPVCNGDPEVGLLQVALDAWPCAQCGSFLVLDIEHGHRIVLSAYPAGSER